MFYTQKQTNCLNIVSNINKTGELSQVQPLGYLLN